MAGIKAGVMVGSGEGRWYCPFILAVEWCGLQNYFLKFYIEICAFRQAGGYVVFCSVTTCTVDWLEFCGHPSRLQSGVVLSDSHGRGIKNQAKFRRFWSLFLQLLIQYFGTVEMPVGTCDQVHIGCTQNFHVLAQILQLTLEALNPQTPSVVSPLLKEANRHDYVVLGSRHCWELKPSQSSQNCEWQCLL